MEIVHDGWLIKSPPEKTIWKAKWRQRWFVLRHSGQLPGQFVLEYYTDQTRRKLKGRIDLDQCEQVDSGLQFEGRKSNYEHVFDIRTPKRTYYLVAETEEMMNKWVDCICAVCGLKIHVDEDFVSQSEQQLVTSTSTPSLTSSEASTVVLTPSSVVPPVPPSGEGEAYILMSDCISGPPVLNGSFDTHTTRSAIDSSRSTPPAKPQIRHDRNLSGEFYDYPRPLNPSMHQGDKGRTSPDPNFDDLYKIPPPPQARTSDYASEWEGMTPTGNTYSNSWSPPPKVNWSTYPRGGVCDVEVIHKDASETIPQLERLSFNDSGVESQHSSSPQDMFESVTLDNQGAGMEPALPKPPPRPPKPPSLSEKKKKETCEGGDDAFSPSATAYDIPPPFSAPSAARENFLATRLPLLSHTTTWSTSDESVISPSDLSPTTKVPPPSLSCTHLLDEMYDFPKQRTDDDAGVLNTTVPIGRANLRSSRQRKHSYANAPPGYFTTKEASVFNYEYRPSLPSGTSDGYLSMDMNASRHQGGGEIYTDMSGDGRSPTSPSFPQSSAAYLNVPPLPASPGFLGPQLSDIPPAVNRDLKPRRKISGDETVNSMTLPLVSARACIRSSSTKRSFRKPRSSQSSRTVPSPTLPPSGAGIALPPKLPAKTRQHSEPSTTSDDELSNYSGGGSRRNSSNDDQARHGLVPPPPPKKQGEIQYLDLDLDSEVVQSPKSSEKQHHHHHHHLMQLQPGTSGHGSAAATAASVANASTTVYKTVDFLKTKAFNEMRQNVEESYRLKK